MRKFMTVFIAALVMVGCSLTIKPNYIYEPKNQDPVLVFNSDIELPTVFYVNIDPANNYSPETFQLVGYILHKDSIFLFDVPNKEFQVSVPADQKVVVKALHDFSDGRTYSHCGPFYESFTPQKGKTYLVKMHQIKDYCSLSVREYTKPRPPAPAE